MIENQKQESTRNEEFSDPKNSSEDDDNEEAFSEPQETIAKRNIRKTRSQEAVTALLASFGPTVEKCSDEFSKQDLTFKDMSLLNRKDLELLGIKAKDKQDEMMETFRMLPNQREHFDNVVQSEDAQYCNDLVITRAAEHMESMETSLGAASLKLRIDPSEDIIIEDQSYASRFVLKALDELRKETEEMDDRLEILEETIKRKLEIKSHSRVLKKILIPTILIAGLSTAMSFGFWFWKSR